MDSGLAAAQASLRSLRKFWLRCGESGMTKSVRLNRTLTADALDGGAACRQLVLEPLEAAVEVIDAVDDGFPFCRKRGNDERDRGAQIGRHHRRALERAHPLDGRAFAVELNMRAEPHQLLYVHETVLEDGLGDARGSFR